MSRLTIFTSVPPGLWPHASRTVPARRVAGIGRRALRGGRRRVSGAAGRRRRVMGGYLAVRWFFRTVLKCGFGLTVTGEEHIPRRGPIILAANHRSDIDPVV